MSYELNCPYCDAELEICHDDGFGYDEGVKHQMQCYKCDKMFVFETCILFNYEPYKADCLNGEEHDWKIIHALPKEFAQMECTICETRRDLTEEEKTP